MVFCARARPQRNIKSVQFKIPTEDAMRILIRAGLWLARTRFL